MTGRGETHHFRCGRWCRSHTQSSSAYFAANLAAHVVDKSLKVRLNYARQLLTTTRVSIA
jgi:hypothetical protein